MKNEKKSILVTIGIIVKNEELHIHKTLESISHLDFDFNVVEIIFVDGNSTDQTQNIIKKFIEQNDLYNMRLITEPWNKGTHGMARNLIATNAHGEYLAFTDGDCIVETSWLKFLYQRIVSERKLDKSVAAVGGMRTPAPTNSWKENLLNHVMGTFLGSGGSAGFMNAQKKYTDSIPNYNSIYHTEIVQSEKYSDLGVGEDYEFNLRLKNKGFKIIFEKNAIVYHHQSDSFKDFFIQIFKYGFAQVLIYKKIRRIRYFAIIAPAFVLGLFIGGILSFFFKEFFTIYLYMLCMYGFFVLFYSTQVVFQVRRFYGLLSIIIFPIEHIVYGVGVLFSIIKNYGKHQKSF